MTSSGKWPSRRDGLFALSVIGSVSVALTMRSWRRWPDLVVDFGAQLYLPWQISKGAVLYRDVHYLAGGPLSQYYHALLFKIFGVSFLTIAISNLVIVALLVAAIYICFYRCSDQLTAITASVAVLIGFAFAEYTTRGIFNYITPYSAEVVHGLALSVLAVALLSCWLETGKLRYAGGVGLCCGLTLLTKPDMFLALGLTVAAGALMFRLARGKGQWPGRSLLVMAGIGIIPAAVCFLCFFRVEGFQQSARSVFAAWIPLLTTRAAGNPFYRWCLGLDTPWVHLQQTIVQFFSLAGIVAVCALGCLRKIPDRLCYVAVLPVGVALFKVSLDYNWFNCGFCLPLVCLTLLALLVWRVAKAGWEAPLVFGVLWAFWSLALLAKLGLFSRIWHYGFALAMPAFVSGVYLLLWALPRQLDSWGVRTGLFRGLMCLLLTPGLWQLTQGSLNMYTNKTMAVGTGADTILTFGPHSRMEESDVAEALRWMETNAPPRATLAVLPQGAMLNYLSRRVNPSGYVAWNPPELAAFGQERMTESFKQHSPDFVIVIYKDYGEYGEEVFGARQRFGQDVMQWIHAHYTTVKEIDWLENQRQFEVTILKKNGE